MNIHFVQTRVYPKTDPLFCNADSHFTGSGPGPAEETMGPGPYLGPV